MQQGKGKTIEAQKYGILFIFHKLKLVCHIFYLNACNSKSNQNNLKLLNLLIYIEIIEYSTI